MTSLPHVKRALALMHDLAAVIVCWFVAYWLRFNLDLPEIYLTSATQALKLFLFIHALVYWLFGLYRGIWRYASLMDLRRIILAVGLSALIVAVAIFMLSLPLIPRSVIVLHPILLIMAMGGSRFVYRAWRDQMLYGRMVVA